MTSVVVVKLYRSKLVFCCQSSTRRLFYSCSPAAITMSLPLHMCKRPEMLTSNLHDAGWPLSRTPDFFSKPGKDSLMRPGDLGNRTSSQNMELLSTKSSDKNLKVGIQITCKWWKQKNRFPRFFSGRSEILWLVQIFKFSKWVFTLIINLQLAANKYVWVRLCDLITAKYLVIPVCRLGLVASSSQLPRPMRTDNELSLSISTPVTNFVNCNLASDSATFKSPPPTSWK